MGHWIRLFTTRPWPLVTLKLLVVALFLLIIVAGLFGTPIPERNIATVLTWNLWWLLCFSSDPPGVQCVPGMRWPAGWYADGCGDVVMPMRTHNANSAVGFSRADRSSIANALRIARSAASSWAWGCPK